MITVRSNEQLETEERERSERAIEYAQPTEVTMQLAGHVKTCFNDAKQHRDNPDPVTNVSVTERMISNVRAKLGQYDEETLAAIRKNNASEIYMRIIATKARALSGWLRDILMGSTDKPWSIDPTPEPDLPGDVMAEIHESVGMMLADIQQAVAMGEIPPPDPSMISQEVIRQTNAARWERYETAASIIKQKERVLDDQLQEGGFYKALIDFVDDVTIYPTAVLKGPIVRRKAKLGWVDNQVEVVEELVSEFERANPMDIYPSPHAASPNDGYIIQLHRLTPTALNQLIGVPGYDEDAIRAALNAYRQRGSDCFKDEALETQKADMENKEDGHSRTDPIITAIEYYGSVQGHMLLEWGMGEDEVDDPDLEYECVVWLVGDYVIKAFINPDPLNRRPFYTASFENIPDSFWGLSLADNLDDCQKMCNACARAIDRNMAVASGPQAAVNIDRWDGEEDFLSIYPLKVWPMKSDPLGSSSPPVQFFQPSSNAQELFFVFEKFYALADEFSSLPRYMQGMPSSANRTATGLSMLMDAASKGVKQVIGNIDEAIKGLVERLYQHNMLFGDDESIKGDVQIKALGSTLLSQKELQQMRLNEFLQATANPLDSEIMGMEGRAYLLHEVVKSLNLDADRIVPPPSMQMQNPMGGMAMGANANNMNPAGGAPTPQGGGGATLQNGAPVTNLIR